MCIRDRDGVELDPARRSLHASDASGKIRSKSFSNRVGHYVRRGVGRIRDFVYSGGGGSSTSSAADFGKGSSQGGSHASVDEAAPMETEES